MNSWIGKIFKNGVIVFKFLLHINNAKNERIHAIEIKNH